MRSQKTNNRLLVIIPAYNEEKSIVKVVVEVKKTKLATEIVIINDGSTDSTGTICSKIPGITLLNLPFNLGIGGSVQTGLKYAFINNFDQAVQIDGDGQHDPKYLVKLLKFSNNSNLVIGSRYIEKTLYKTPVLRMAGIRVFSFLINLTCAKKVFDPTSGYRVFGKNVIELSTKYYPQEFPEPLSIVYFLRNGLSIKEVSVETRQRTSGKSSIGFMYSIYLMISISIAMLLEAYKKNND